MIHLPSARGLDRVDCERQEEEEEVRCKSEVSWKFGKLVKSAVDESENSRR